MKKILFGIVLFLVLTICSGYFYIKLNPPVEIGTLASSSDQKSAVVGIGNAGFSEVKIIEVLVNNNKKPAITRLQVSNALQGFILTDDFNSSEAKKYGFTSIETVSIKTGTSPTSNFNKLDNETASKADKIYGISVIDNKEINKIHIKYDYLGMSFDDSVILNNPPIDKTGN